MSSFRYAEPSVLSPSTRFPLPKGTIAAPYKQHLADYNQWSAEQFMTADIHELVANRALYFDRLCQHLWQQLGFTDDDLTLVAVGGYGRGTLHPGSDIDLLFLHRDDITKVSLKHQEQIHQFTALLWDMHVDVGHTVRSVAECRRQAANDISIATSLIEHRYLAGNEHLMAALSQMVEADFPWSSSAFYHAKLAEQKQRHNQFHGTSYNLEPNLKSSPGGLRDIQTIGWIAKQHFTTQTDESLVDYGYMTGPERVELLEHMHLLWRVRYALHLEADKCEDRLLFDYQPSVAARLGYGNEGKAAVEAMMQDYFTAVLGVSELNHMLLQFFERAILTGHVLSDPQVLDANFCIQAQHISARHDLAFEQPQALLQFFIHIADHPHIKDIEPQTIRLLRDARERLEHSLCEDDDCRLLFMHLLRHKGFGRAFELLHRSRIMAHYLPQWRQIVGQMQFDLFHAYTVDEHTFRLVRNLYRYTDPEFNEDFPLCQSIVEDFEKPELLYLAGIFHDIAKGRGGDHSELGAQDARNFAALHELPKADGELIAWLVLHHLDMSVTAQKRDIHDPAVVHEFAQLVGSKLHLDYLYCLTVADIRATNKSLWNNWKATLLEELYHATAELLQRTEVNTAVEMRRRIHDHKSHAMALLLSAGEELSRVQETWGRFTADYFLRHRAEQIAWHTQYILHLSVTQSLPLVLVNNENTQGITELFVYHQEQSHLFAAVAAVLDSQQLLIHDAQILATRDGYVMDSFMVLQHDGKPLTKAHDIEALQQTLYDVLHGRAPVPCNRRRVPRRLRNFSVPTQIEFLSEQNKRRTLFEITALDRPGLVAQVARVLQEMQLNVLAAKITTIGEQAEDLFIVSTTQQMALNEAQKIELRERLIAALTD